MKGKALFRNLDDPGSNPELILRIVLTRSCSRHCRMLCREFDTKARVEEIVEDVVLESEALILSVLFSIHIPIEYKPTEF